ncbi:MAG TPA: alpha/beta hydrolase [Actinomycetota bacterium]|jgi:dienelactone hydrolase|nr:alpha/beta hydrolase [Actinomycetota bacterium]
MDWIGDPQVSRGVNERRFDLDVDGEVVPGILWTPENATGTRPLVLIGHGGSQHKRAPNVLALARRLVRHLGYAAAAIDGPMHGDRVEGGNDLTLDVVRRRMNEDPEHVQRRFRAARNEWSQTLTALKQVDGVGDGPTGYWGLSMGTVIGLPFVAGEPRIDAAVLGLMGIPIDAKGESARAITIPLLFLVQWDDELVKRTDALALFDTLGSQEKTMHVNPGVHVAVPPEEIAASERFFAKHLGAPGVRGVPAEEVPAATS